MMKKIIFFFAFSILSSSLAFGQINIMPDKSIGMNTLPYSFAGVTINNIPTTQNNGVFLYFQSGTHPAPVALRTVLKHTAPTSTNTLKGLTFGFDTPTCNDPNNLNCNYYDVIGVENEFSGLETKGKIVAFRNAWQKVAQNTTSCYGIENIFTFRGTAVDYGIRQTITIDNSTTFAGTFNHKYGYYNKFLNTANIPLGNQMSVIGVYSSVESALFHPNSAAAMFDGRVVVNGTFVNASDKNLKNNISDLPNALDLVKKLAPKNYYLNNEAPVLKNGKTTAKKHYGLVAQDVEVVMPDIVEEFDVPKTTTKTVKEKVQKTKTEKDKNGNDVQVSYTEDVDKQVTEITGYTKYKGINYTELIAVLMQAVKEQQATIETLQKDVEVLKAKVK